MREKHYNELLEKVRSQLEAKNRRLMQMGTYRVITFVGIVLGIIWCVQEMSLLSGLFGLSMITIFVLLVKRYNANKKEISYMKAKEKVLERYLQRLQDDMTGWKSFKDNGKAYLDEADTVAKDLDLVGRSSIYQYLNVCHTPFGREKLAEALKKGCRSKEEILNRQGAVKELISDENFSLHLQTLSRLMEEGMSAGMSNGTQKRLEKEELLAFINEAEKKEVSVGKGMKVLSYVLPFITLFAIVSAVMKRYIVPSYIIACLGILIQMAIGFGGARKSSALLSPAYAFVKKVSIYEAFLSSLEESTFSSSYLKMLQDKLHESGGAVRGLRALKGLSMAIDVRYNGILYGIVNSLLMWDVHCKDALGNWNEQYGSKVREWLEIVGEVEVLLSLAVMGQIKEKYCFPEIIESKEPQFKFKDLAHPLIQETKVVSNSYEMKGATCIITGSNMSGKTTFLRSIGTNLALAYAGGVVLASEFKTSKMQLFTSMRVEDRVDQGISTFYAEILRIKEMVSFSKRQEPMLVLIDEIFKGTNSADRIVGAEETIKRLGKPWVNVMVSTHDFELCNLTDRKDRKYMNYHFEEYYEGDKILFDYCLREGKSKTTNARYLLKMAGIIEVE